MTVACESETESGWQDGRSCHKCQMSQKPSAGNLSETHTAGPQAWAWHSPAAPARTGMRGSYCPLGVSVKALPAGREALAIALMVAGDWRASHILKPGLETASMPMVPSAAPV